MSAQISRARRTRLELLFSEVRITNHPQRGGMDEIHVAAHQLGERRFGAVFSVGAQQL